MVNNVFETVKKLVNADSAGNFSPKAFDLLLHNSVLEKYEELLFEVNRLLNKQNRGLLSGGLENTATKHREKIQYYLKESNLTYADGKFTLPADLRYFDALFFNNEEIELCRNNSEFKLIESVKNTTPDENYPIGLRQGNTVKILPTTIVSNVNVSYLRNPIPAKWTYVVIDGVEIFNPSASDYKDIDIHPSDEDDIIIRVLKKFGINLKEKDIQEITSRDEINQFTSNNTN